LLTPAYYFWPSEIVLFEPLSSASLVKVAELRVAELARALLEKDIRLEASQSALQRIVQVSYDPSYGARPIRRWIERALVTRISHFLVSGELAGGDTILVDLDGDGLSYTIVTPPPAAGDTMALDDGSEQAPTTPSARTLRTSDAARGGGAEQSVSWFADGAEAAEDAWVSTSPPTKHVAV